MTRRACALSFLLCVACKKSPPPSDSIAQPIASAEPRKCDGLDPKTCVTRKGCLLDQPGPGKYECRLGRNACELAVRQGDLIGPDVRGVTPTANRLAKGMCNGTPGCSVAGGRCSCPCAVFGDCDCDCGGGWLARCAPVSEVQKLDGYPGK